MEDDVDDPSAHHPASLGPRRGAEQDRGRRRAIGLDLGALAGDADFAPVVEYLTAIQTMRGDGGSLLFVRDDDLDAMAEHEGRPVPEFLDRLDQLGVIVSSN